MVPNFETIWRRMQAHAEDCIRTKRAIPTLQRGVINYITDVSEKRIGRSSEDGRSDNQSCIRKAKAEQYWDFLCGRRSDYYVLYFIPAFMLDALPDIVENLGNGQIALKKNPSAVVPNHKPLTKIATKPVPQLSKIATAKPFPGGEGELHRSIKQAIHERPNEVLAGLRGGPFTPHAIEFSFETGDRVDVVLRDAEERIVLVEVKPFLASDTVAPFAQAAKYRTLWSIFEGWPVSDIRALVVAPEIPTELATKMLTLHEIESHAVSTSWL